MQRTADTCAKRWRTMLFPMSQVS